MKKENRWDGSLVAEIESKIFSSNSPVTLVDQNILSDFFLIQEKSSFFIREKFDKTIIIQVGSQASKYYIL